MQREVMIESAASLARELGWEEVEHEDDGATVTLLLSASGATEQMTEPCPLRKLRKEVGELGGPENYPATEEYDAPPSTLDLSDEGIEKTEAYYEETDPKNIEGAVEEACDGAIEPEKIDAEDVKNMQAEVRTPSANLAAGEPEGLHEDTHDDPSRRDGPVNIHGYSPKETCQAMQVQNQDRGGIPRPNQYLGGKKMSVGFNGEQYVAPENHHIEARRVGEATRVYGLKISEVEKLGMSAAGWRFFAVKNTKVEETLLAGGAVTVKNRRFVAAEGHVITARKGNQVFMAHSLHTGYKKAGWALSVS